MRLTASSVMSIRFRDRSASVICNQYVCHTYVLVNKADLCQTVLGSSLWLSDWSPENSLHEFGAIKAIRKA